MWLSGGGGANCCKTQIVVWLEPKCSEMKNLFSKQRQHGVTTLFRHFHTNQSYDPRVAASDRKSDGCIFGRNSDPIVEAKTKFFEKSIYFNSIKQYINLIELKWIKLNSIFYFFIKLDRIHFYFSSDRKIKTASDPIQWPPYTTHYHKKKKSKITFSSFESFFISVSFSQTSFEQISRICVLYNQCCFFNYFVMSW